MFEKSICILHQWILFYDIFAQLNSTVLKLTSIHYAQLVNSSAIEQLYSLHIRFDKIASAVDFEREQLSAIQEVVYRFGTAWEHGLTILSLALKYLIMATNFHWKCACSVFIVCYNLPFLPSNVIIFFLKYTKSHVIIFFVKYTFCFR